MKLYKDCTKEIKTAKSKAVEGDALTMLQSMTDLDLSAGKVFEFEAANTRLDRTGERFSFAVLEKFAEGVNNEGRSFLWGHQRDQVVGKVFKADINQAEDGHFALNEFVFIMDGIMLPGQGVELSKAIEAGLVDFVSVGFSAYMRKVEENGKTLFEYYFDPMNKDHQDYTEQTELSAVYLGAQRGARKKEHNNDSEMEQKIIELESRIKELETENGTLKSDNETLKADVKSLTEVCDELTAEVEKYVEPIRNELLNLQAKFLPEGGRMTEDQVKMFSIDQIQKMIEGFKSKDKPEEKEEKSIRIGF